MTVTSSATRAIFGSNSESVWPHFYAGTMGRVQRDCIERFRHVLRYSRQHSTICNALTDAGWFAGLGAMRGIDGREIGKSDLVVIWGGNPVSTQINVMKHVAEAWHQRGAKLVVVDPYRTGTAAVARTAPPPCPGCISIAVPDCAIVSATPSTCEAHHEHKPPTAFRDDRRSICGAIARPSTVFWNDAIARHEPYHRLRVLLRRPSSATNSSRR